MFVLEALPSQQTYFILLRLFTHNNQRIMYTQSKYFYKILGLSLASVELYFPQVEFDIFYWRHKNVRNKKKVGLVYGYTQNKISGYKGASWMLLM